MQNVFGQIRYWFESKKIEKLTDRVLWLCIALGLVKHSDRYDGAVFFMALMVHHCSVEIN